MFYGTKVEVKGVPWVEWRELSVFYVYIGGSERCSMGREEGVKGVL